MLFIDLFTLLSSSSALPAFSSSYSRPFRQFPLFEGGGSILLLVSLISGGPRVI